MFGDEMGFEFFCGVEYEEGCVGVVFVKSICDGE